MFRRTTNMWEIHTKLSKSLHAKEGLGTLRTQDVRGYTSILFGKKMTKTVPLNSLTCHQCQDDQHIWHGCFKRHEHIEKNNTFKGVLGTQCIIVVFIPFLYSSIGFLAIWHVFCEKDHCDVEVKEKQYWAILNQFALCTQYMRVFEMKEKSNTFAQIFLTKPFEHIGNPLVWNAICSQQGLSEKVSSTPSLA